MKRVQHDRSARFSYRRNACSKLIVLFLSCAFILAACGGNSSNATSSNSSQKSGNLVVGLIAEPTTLDPLRSASLYDTDIMENIYDTLFKYDTHNVIQPELVSSYTYASPTVLNLTLHTGVKFQDGTPFNADAVIFNLNRFISTKDGPRYTDVQTIDTMQKVSDSQVQIKLKKPFAPLLDKLTSQVGMMLSPTAVKNLGAKLKNAPVNAGCGAFIFVEWIKSDHLLLKANPNYWQKDAQGNRLPYLQSIRYRTITNDTVMYNNLETNQIQVASDINPNTIAQAKANPSLIYGQVPTPGFQSIQLNVSAPPFNNVHVRRAIAWAINRQEIIEHVWKGVYVVAKGPLSPATWAYDKNYAGMTYDPNKAKTELAQASGSGNISFTMLLTGNNPTLLQAAQFIQSELQAVGITLNIKQEVFATLVQDWQTFNYQAVFVGWTGSLDPDGTLYAMFTTKGGFNYTKDSVPQVDALLEQARTTADQAQRIPLYQEAERLIVDDAARIFIWHAVSIQATSSKVKNYALLPSRILDFTSVSLIS